jgi:hypothetical protein
MRENVEHHIEEEEEQMFPRCRQLPNLEELRLSLVRRTRSPIRPAGNLSRVTEYIRSRR